MTLPDSDADPFSSTYHVQIGEGKGIVIGNHAHVEQHFYSIPAEPQVDLIAAKERERFLRALLADHSSFMRDRLDNFVGREQELAKIRQRIAEKQQTGGYVTITGQAGQGKSSIIAKLVNTYQQEGGPEKIAFHFIPFNPGPDHQVGLLRNLMACLILKYNLSDLYVASDSRPALRDYFPKVLGELAAQGGQEVIFIDGLDQLEADATGVRDLSFLPNNPPPGVVFVLGTRPNDTLKPLELLKPHHEYRLPNLSQEDFECILHRRNVQLERGLAGRFYAAMQGNALYLDLLAKELAEQGTTDPELLIKQVADNPEHLFSLTMARFKQQPAEWREIIKPVLGVLLVAQEPLGVRDIRQILGVDDDRLREGVVRLGGLLVRDWQQRYSLFHVKLYEYLRQDKQCSDKEYIFAVDEEENWHKRLAQWCEGSDLSTIWQDVKHDAVEQLRCEYARQFYITHLYHAKTWLKLFDILDNDLYAQAKLHYDPSTYLYSQDLRLGQLATMWGGWMMGESLDLLPLLWSYTLRRCNLASEADLYLDETFRLLVLLKYKTRALRLAELLTNPARKASALLQIARQIRKQQENDTEFAELLWRAQKLIEEIKEPPERARTLSELGQAFALVGLWEQAETIWAEAEAIIRAMENHSEQSKVKSALSIALAQAQQWEWAEGIIHTIEDSMQQTQAMSALGTSLAQAQQWERAGAIWAEARKEIGSQIHLQAVEALYHLAGSLAEVQQWERAEVIWAEASAILSYIGTPPYETIFDPIGDGKREIMKLSKRGIALALAQKWEQAHAVWAEIESLIWSLRGDHFSFIRSAKIKLQAELGKVLMQSQLWSKAEEVIYAINDNLARIGMMSELGAEKAQVQQWEGVEWVWTREEDQRWYGHKDERREEAIRKLVTVLAQEQHWERAKEIIDQAGNVYPWGGMIITELSKALIQTQQWKRAEIVIGKIKSTFERSDMMRALGIAQAQVRQWIQAEQGIQAVQDFYVKIQAIIELGTILAQKNQWEQANVKWREAEEAITLINDEKKQSELMNALGGFLSRVQQWERAEEVIEKIRDGHWYRIAMFTLGIALAQAQQWERAETVIKRLGDDQWQAGMMSELGIALAQAQQWERAETVIKRLGDDQWQAGMMSELGIALAQAQQWERAETVIKKIGDSYWRARTLTELGKALTQAQQWVQADKIWTETETVIYAMEESSPRHHNLWNLFLITTQDIFGEQVQAMLSKGECWKKEALIDLAEALADTRQWERFERLLNKPISDYLQCEILKRLGESLARNGQYEQLLHLVQHSFFQAKTPESASALLVLVYGLLPLKPELGSAFVQKIA